MNRLTERHYVEKEGYYLKCSETPNCPNDCEECDRLDDAINRLGEYENTGLPPEACANYKTFEDECISKGVTFSRIVELMNADAAWCRSCQYNQRGACLYCRNDGADDTIAEACTRRAAEWLEEDAK